jgi:hypothetical protein
MVIVSTATGVSGAATVSGAGCEQPAANNVRTHVAREVNFSDGLQR